MKKFKNKILVPIITSLSTVALVAPLATSVTTKTLNNNGSLESVNDAANATSYVTITYNADKDLTEGWEVTIQGPNRVRVRSGHSFGSAQKPTPVHSKGWKFLGWSTTARTAADIVDDTDPVSTNLNLYPVFESADMIIQGSDTLFPTQTQTYSVLSSSGKATDIEWSIPTGGWVPAMGAEYAEGTEPTLDKSVPGKVTIKGQGTSHYEQIPGKLTLQAKDNTTGIIKTKVIDVNYPNVNSDKVWTADDEDNKFYSLNIDDLCNENSTTIRGYELNEGTEKTYNKNAFNNSIFIGENITYLPDNFGINLTNFNALLSFGEEDYFGLTSKCRVIGKCFLQNDILYNNDSTSQFRLTLPNSLVSIDDGFLYGCTIFNNNAAGSFVIPDSVVNIGSWFMYGCEEFNQNITIPSSVTHVGEHFMADCHKFCSTLTVNTDAENFDVFGDISYTLTTNSKTKAAYATGVTIAGAKSIGFIKKFVNRDDAAPYRNLIQGESDFKTCEWDDIIYWANAVETNKKTVDQLCEHYGFTDHDVGHFAGLEKTMSINGKDHIVRCLQVQHNEDVIVESGVATSTKATFTFEVATLLSDSNGDQYLSKWDTTNNHDYTKSQLRKNLTGQGTGTLQWYDKTMAASTETRTALQMLPSEIQSNIKTVQKSVAISTDSGGSYTATAYQDKLFPLTYTEMAQSGSASAIVEGVAYTHWTNNQAKSEVYRLEGLKKKDANNNYSTQNFYRILSPVTTGSGTWAIYNSGQFIESSTTSPFAIAFAFCI